MSINKKRVRQIFDEIMRQIYVGIPTQSRKTERLFVIEGFAMTLFGRSKELFNECVEEILKEKSVASSTSRDFIENLVARWIKACVENDISDTEHIIKEGLAIFEGKLNRYELSVPIDNLILKDLSLLIGNVRLFKFDDFALGNWFEKYTGYSVDKKHAIGKRVEPLKDRAIAHVIVHAFDEKQAVEIARQEVESVLNVLRWVGFYINGSIQRAWIGMSGEVHRQLSLPSILEQSDKVTLPRAMQGALRPYEIGERVAIYYTKFGLSNISRILKKPIQKRSEMEKRLLTAVNFFGKAVQETDPVDAFLKTTIAMETLLLRDNNTEPITGNLSERTAFLLKDTLDGRLELRRLVSTLYGTRSRIAHHGSTDEAMASLPTIQNICFDLLYKVASIIDKHETVESLVGWIDELKFS